jgi:hypothetical protein
VKLPGGDALSVYVGAGEDCEPRSGDGEIVLHIAANDIVGIRDDIANRVEN